jgi:hypothetical protein
LGLLSLSLLDLFEKLADLTFHHRSIYFEILLPLNLNSCGDFLRPFRLNTPVKVASLYLKAALVSTRAAWMMAMIGVLGSGADGQQVTV